MFVWLLTFCAAFRGFINATVKIRLGPQGLPWQRAATGGEPQPPPSSPAARSIANQTDGMDHMAVANPLASPTRHLQVSFPMLGLVRSLA